MLDIFKKFGAEKRQLSPKEIAVFCAQIGMMMKAGIIVEDGIAVMCEDTLDAEGKAIMVVIKDKMEEGAAFSTALEESKCFPKYVVDMVQLGEKSGKLETVLDSLTIYYEQREALAQNIKSAVTYPLVMMAMMLMVVGVLVIKVLPIFNSIFEQLGSEVSGFAKILMNFGSFLERYALVIVAVAAFLAIAFFILSRSRQGRLKLSIFWSRFILTRKMAAQVASGRFASAMAMMVSSGLDTDEALEMTCRILDEGDMKNRVRECREEMQSGRSFAEVLEEKRIFTGLYAKMVSVGFKTGTIDEVMRKLAQRYDDEIQANLSRIVAIIEPTLVMILSVIVGMILLSVMLPLMGIMSSIG